MEGALRDVANNLAVDCAALDRSRNRVVIRMQLDVRTVGTVQALSVWHLGESATALVHCYARERDFANRLPTFERLNNSLQFDEGHRFVPTADSALGPFSWAGWRPGTVIGGFAGAMVGLALAVFKLVAGRGSTASSLNDPFPPGSAIGA